MTQPPPAWLDELPLRPGPPWHPMGTRPVGGDPTYWLAVTGDDPHERAAQLAAKAAILDDPRLRAEAVVRLDLPDLDLVEAAAGELLAPGAGDLEAAAATVPDDVCVLVRHDGHWRLVSGVVCFPSVWRPAAKVGLPLAGIHDPVPGYADELADRVDRVLDRLRPDRPLWRRNWFLHRSPVLHQPLAAPDDGPAEVPGGFWLRSERQALRRLPTDVRLDAAVFTIRTQLTPLATLRHRPDVARGIAEALRTWPDDLVAYRRAGAWRGAVADWLDAAA